MTSPLPPLLRPTYPPRPAALVAAVVFFVAAGGLDLVLSIREIEPPRPFWPVWEAIGRALAHVLLAVGLWQRMALCRTIALVYCLASVIVYLFALALAWSQAPVRFPDSVVLQSVLQVPSCVLLFGWLRSDAAGRAFTPGRV